MTKQKQNNFMEKHISKSLLVGGKVLLLLLGILLIGVFIITTPPTGLALLPITISLWALWSVRKQSKKHYFSLGILYVLLLIIGNENYNAGMVADAKGISGCDASILGCLGVPLFMAIAFVTMTYQIILIVRYYHKSNTRK